MKVTADYYSFARIKRQLTPSGLWDNGLYQVSKDTITIPKIKMEEAIFESLPKGFKGVNEPCSIITIDGNSWEVLGDVTHRIK